MSAYDFMWNAIQQGELSEHAQTIEELNKKCDILYEWVKYLNAQIEELKNGNVSAKS